MLTVMDTYLASEWVANQLSKFTDMESWRSETNVKTQENVKQQVKTFSCIFAETRQKKHFCSALESHLSDLVCHYHLSWGTPDN